MGMAVSGTGVVKHAVVSRSDLRFPKKPLPAACSVVEKEKGVAGRATGKRQIAPGTKGTNNPTPFTNIKGDTPASFREMQTPDSKKKLKGKFEQQLKE